LAAIRVKWGNGISPDNLPSLSMRAQRGKEHSHNYTISGAQKHSSATMRWQQQQQAIC